MALSKRLSIVCKQYMRNYWTFQKNIDFPQFPGAKTRWTYQLKFTRPANMSPIPVYRVMDKSGDIINKEEDPKLSKDIVLNMYKYMSLLKVMDKNLTKYQHEGRISLYLTSTGEEAAIIGSAAALTNEDVVYAQYREAGAILWRGYTLAQIMNQCHGNAEDNGKGKQAPIHYGSKESNYVTISSPISTQISQAVGASYVLKNQNRVVLVYFGEGAASEGEAYAAFNFAATLDCPVIFFCRNNGYAISTPTLEQYRGDGIAGRGPSSGINSLRCDGNDIFAVYNATKTAKEFSINENKPVLIEAMTYRTGEHSASDLNSGYRSAEEISYWATQENPITRLRMYMEKQEYWNEELEKAWVEKCNKDVVSNFEEAERKLKPNWKELFSDVYHEMPKHLKEQMAEMEQHVKDYSQHYPLKNFAS